MLQLEHDTLLECTALCIENEILIHLKTQKDDSLHEPLGQDQEGNEISLINVLKSENEDVIDTIQLNLELDKIKRHINILDEREKQVIFGRFGLNFFFKKTHKKKL